MSMQWSRTLKLSYFKPLALKETLSNQIEFPSYRVKKKKTFYFRGKGILIYQAAPRKEVNNSTGPAKDIPDLICC